MSQCSAKRSRSAPQDPVDRQIHDLRELLDHLDQRLDVATNGIAHNEVEWNPGTQNFCSPDLATIGALYATLEEVLPVTVRSVVHLALVLRSTDIAPEELERLWKQHTATFGALALIRSEDSSFAERHDP